MDAAHRSSARPVLVPASLCGALFLGLVARFSEEPVFGTVGAALLIVAVAAGAGEALARLQSVYPFRHAYLIPATTALGLYAAGGGVPHVAAIVLVGVALIAGAVGESKAWPLIRVTAPRPEPVRQTRSAEAA